MAAESPVNGVGTTLASSITNVATSCSLASATGFTNAQYHVLITDGANYEIALATALSGTTLTITRAVEAYNGTQSAYAFAAASSITVVTSVQSVANFIESQPYLSPLGLTGATQASRYVGATTSGAPTSGTFAKGDFVIDYTATIWVCTAAGTPGTWAPTASQDVVNRSATATATLGEVTVFTGSTASQTITLPANGVNGTEYTIINNASVSVNIVGGTNSIQFGATNYSATTPYTVGVGAAYGFVFSSTLGYWTKTWTTDITALPGTLGVSNGGTGLTTLTAANNALYSTSSSALAAGTLPIAAGGTAATSAANALSNLGALPTAGGTMSGAIAMGSNKITGLANGTASSDAAAFGQIPTALPPNGSASGDLSGSYPSPTVAKLNGVAISAGLATVLSQLGGAATVTTTTTISASYPTVLVGPTTASQTFTLPTSPTQGTALMLLHYGTLPCTITAGGTNNIGIIPNNYGVTSFTLNPSQSVYIVFAGSTWYGFTSSKGAQVAESYPAAGSPVSITSGSWQNITSISLTPGTWLITGRATFTGTNTSLTFADLIIGPNSGSVSGNYGAASAAIGNLAGQTEWNSVSITRVVTLTATTTVYLEAYASASGISYAPSTHQSTAANDATGLTAVQIG